MFDKKNKNKEGESNLVLPEKPLVIHLEFFSSTGDLRFEGPVNYPTLCYGILEMAKDVVRKHNGDMKIQSALTLPEGFLPHGK